MLRYTIVNGKNTLTFSILGVYSTTTIHFLDTDAKIN